MSRRDPKWIASRLSDKGRRFVLAGSARRAKSYATLVRHSRGGCGRALQGLFLEVRADRRRRTPRWVLSGLGVKVKRRLGGRS